MALEKQIPGYMLRPYLHDLDAGGENAESHTTDAAPIPLKRIQQSDNHRDFFSQITLGGLEFAYCQVDRNCPASRGYHKLTGNPKHVIIVGAGMSGLVSAYELSQVGHKVTILELQHRLGGRVKTIREPFSDGLHVEGGAMRLPGTGERGSTGPSHFLTDNYLLLFNIPIRPFQNENENGLLDLYDTVITMNDWKANNKKYTDMFWKGWDRNLPAAVKALLNITGINSYYEQTMKPVKDELINDHSIQGWNVWVNKWSRLSVRQFLETDTYQSTASLKLRPWPQEAITAHAAGNYSPFMDISLVEALREDLGRWWEDPMHTPIDGMDALPKAFAKQNIHGWNKKVHLSRDIRYGVNVFKIEYQDADKKSGVIVTARNTSTGELHTYNADAVIITTPLTILRQMDIPLSLAQSKAIANITYMTSTKILLQCKSRFWHKKYNIQGGFSKSTKPYGQLHYPDWVGSGISTDDRGILMSYTWDQDGMIFGSQSPKDAVASVVRQLANIHPEITEEFEVGTTQAWTSDPSSQGAYAYLHPYQYNTSMKALIESNHPIYLAGEALSWTNGWIQGALESGMRAAYQFHAHNENEALRKD